MDRNNYNLDNSSQHLKSLPGHVQEEWPRGKSPGPLLQGGAQRAGGWVGALEQPGWGWRGDLRALPASQGRERAFCQPAPSTRLWDPGLGLQCLVQSREQTQEIVCCCFFSFTEELWLREVGEPV